MVEALRNNSDDGTIERGHVEMAYLMIQGKNKLAMDITQMENRLKRIGVIEKVQGSRGAAPPDFDMKKEFMRRILDELRDANEDIMRRHWTTVINVYNHDF